MELDDVHKLTYELYHREGYCSEREDKRLEVYPHLDNIPETVVFTIYLGDELVGTVSATIDGPQGLNTDIDFPRETRQFRNKYRIGSIWRLGSRRKQDTKVVVDLFRMAIESLVSRGAEVCLSIINPKHEAIYKRILGMRHIADRENARGLKNAPAVLIKVHKEDLPKRWQK